MYMNSFNFHNHHYISFADGETEAHRSVEKLKFIQVVVSRAGIWSWSWSLFSTTALYGPSLKALFTAFFQLFLQIKRRQMCICIATEVTIPTWFRYLLTILITQLLKQKNQVQKRLSYPVYFKYKT